MSELKKNHVKLSPAFFPARSEEGEDMFINLNKVSAVKMKGDKSSVLLEGRWVDLSDSQLFYAAERCKLLSF